MLSNDHGKRFAFLHIWNARADRARRALNDSLYHGDFFVNTVDDGLPVPLLIQSIQSLHVPRFTAELRLRLRWNILHVRGVQ